MTEDRTETHTINGNDFVFRHVPARTPRQTGFNGRRREPAHVAVRWTGCEVEQWAFPTIEAGKAWIAANVRETV